MGEGEIIAGETLEEINVRFVVILEIFWGNARLPVGVNEDFERHFGWL
jgi:hypothetical protein